MLMTAAFKERGKVINRQRKKNILTASWEAALKFHSVIIDPETPASNHNLTAIITAISLAPSIKCFVKIRSTTSKVKT